MIDDRYVMNYPTDQVGLDIFAGEWSSLFPEWFKLKAGPIPLFEDPRIGWVVGKSGGLQNKTVLELGPLEGAHTYMLEKFGARDVLSIEANKRAFVRCLMVKNVLNMRSKFLLGDFMKYLEAEPPRVDFCLCSGVIYHMEDPLKLLYLVSKVADKVGIWTHYYDEAIIKADPNLVPRFPGETAPSGEYGGLKTTYYKHYYKESKALAGFCGGSAPHSYWMGKEALLGALRHYGYAQVDFQDNPKHAHGPCYTVWASKEKPPAPPAK